MKKNLEIEQSNVKNFKQLIKTPKKSVIARSEKQSEYIKALKENDLMNWISFMRLTVFLKSSFVSPGTPAFNLNKIDEKQAKNRLTEFQLIADNIKKNYRKKLINKTTKVLFENKMNISNRYFGRDEFFNSVIVESNHDLIGQIKDVKILKGNLNTLFGEIISNLNENNYAA